jgi:hypothetical protein
MSLINDALKRANQTQPTAPPAEGPALRPHFAPGRTQRSTDWLLPALIVVILVLAAALIWEWFRSDAVASVRARTFPENVMPASAPQPVVAPVPAPVAEKLLPTNSPASNSNAPISSNLTNAPVAPVTPPPPAYKLQSVFFRAKSPAAVINGKTLAIGDHVAGARVTAIDKESVTIITPEGETKVLELP